MKQPLPPEGKMPEQELPYDFEDFGMTEEELRDKYPGGHSEYTTEKWRSGPADNDPNHNGYWDWVIQRIAEDDAAY